MILLISLIIVIFVNATIDAILYDYDVSYRTHIVLAYITYFTLFATLIVSLITYVSTSNSSYKSTSTIPIVTSILLSVHQYSAFQVDDTAITNIQMFYYITY